MDHLSIEFTAAAMFVLGVWFWGWTLCRAAKRGDDLNRRFYADHPGRERVGAPRMASPKQPDWDWPER